MAIFRALLAVLLGLALTSCAASRLTNAPTRVMAVSAMHGFHRGHPSYSYDDLFATVRAFEPDLVGVEIRQEDLIQDEPYLARNYPHEMIVLAKEFGSRAFGFDWLGPELEGRPVPENWWKEQSWVKRLEREKEKDKEFQSDELEMLQAQELEIMKSATSASLNDGRYDDLSRAYYRVFDDSVRGSRYEPLARFYRERDRQIAANISRMIEAHPGKRIVLVMGADHRPFVIQELRSQFGSAIDFVTVP